MNYITASLDATIDKSRIEKFAKEIMEYEELHPDSNITIYLRNIETYDEYISFLDATLPFISPEEELEIVKIVTKYIVDDSVISFADFDYLSKYVINIDENGRKVISHYSNIEIPDNKYIFDDNANNIEEYHKMDLPEDLEYPFEIPNTISVIIDEYEAARDIYEALVKTGKETGFYTQVDTDASYPNDRMYILGDHKVNRTGIYMIVWKKEA